MSMTGAHQQKHNHLSRAPEWSPPPPPKNGTLCCSYFFFVPLRARFYLCAAGGTVVSQLTRWWTCRNSAVSRKRCTSCCQVTHSVNFKVSYHINIGAGDYIMGWIQFFFFRTSFDYVALLIPSCSAAVGLKVAIFLLTQDTESFVLHIWRLSRYAGAFTGTLSARHSAAPVHIVRTSCSVDVHRSSWSQTEALLIATGVTQNASTPSISSVRLMPCTACKQIYLKKKEKTGQRFNPCKLELRILFFYFAQGATPPHKFFVDSFTMNPSKPALVPSLLSSPRRGMKLSSCGR